MEEPPLYLPNHDIMTTWHNDFEDGIRFAIFGAHNENIEFEEVVILDMTSGEESERINAYLNKLTSE